MSRPVATFKNVLIRNKNIPDRPRIKIDTWEVRSGDRVGIIGPNGSGKSTMLNLISGALVPKQGIVRVAGKVVPIMSIAAGIDERFTAKENVRLIWLFRGIETVDWKTAYDQIITFCDLAWCENLPIAEYSSGMKFNFMMAVSTFYEGDILVMDEFFSTRDRRYQNPKHPLSLDRFLNNFEAIFIATHSIDVVQRYCNRVIVLQDGLPVVWSDVTRGIRKYKRLQKCS